MLAILVIAAIGAAAAAAKDFDFIFGTPPPAPQPSFDAQSPLIIRASIKLPSGAVVQQNSRMIAQLIDSETAEQGNALQTVERRIRSLEDLEVQFDRITFEQLMRRLGSIHIYALINNGWEAQPFSKEWVRVGDFFTDQRVTVVGIPQNNVMAINVPVTRVNS